jgi:hypothetical protein
MRIVHKSSNCYKSPLATTYALHGKRLQNWISVLQSCNRTSNSHLLLKAIGIIDIILNWQKGYRLCMPVSSLLSSSQAQTTHLYSGNLCIPDIHAVISLHETSPVTFKGYGCIPFTSNDSLLQSAAQRYCRLLPLPKWPESATRIPTQ